MSEVKELSEKAKNVMEAIIAKPKSNVAEIAEFVGVSVATVTGSLSTLKKRGYVTVEEGILIPTDEANFEFGNVDSTTTVKPVETSAGTEVIAETIGNGTVAEVIAETAAPSDAASEPPADTTAAADTAETDDDSTPATPSAFGAMVAGATTAPAPAAKKEPGVNKAELARAVFTELGADAKRSDLMARLTAPEVGLSKHGANTYIYNMRKKAGKVTPRGTKPAEGETIDTPAASSTDASAEDVVAITETTPEATAEPAAEIVTAENSTDADPA